MNIIFLLPAYLEKVSREMSEDREVIWKLKCKQTCNYDRMLKILPFVHRHLVVHCIYINTVKNDTIQ